MMTMENISIDVSDDLIRACQELFSSMMSLNVGVGPVVGLEEVLEKSEILALVGVYGNFKGMLGLYTSEKLAKETASSMLDIPVEDLKEDEMISGLSEVANILIGNVASILEDMGDAIKFHLPSVIMGDYLVNSVLDSWHTRKARRFSLIGMPLYIELVLIREEEKG